MPIHRKIKTFIQEIKFKCENNGCEEEYTLSNLTQH